MGKGIFTKSKKVKDVSKSKNNNSTREQIEPYSITEERHPVNSYNMDSGNTEIQYDMRQEYSKNEHSRISGKHNIKDLQIRLVISAILFLLVFTLKQIPETENWIAYCGIMDKIESFDDIYRLEDECILWYNSFADEK